MARPADRPDTKRRLLAAAAACFAEHGFHGTTIRAIAERAGVNVAAGHYHYGSKKDLYLQVLRGEFAAIRAEMARRGATVAPDALARRSRRDVAAILRARVKVMLDVLIGPPPGLHGTLMLREMCDPSEALPVIVDEFIGPLEREMEAIVAYLAPRLPAKAVQRCAFGIVAQAVFYRFSMPALLRLQGLDAFPAGLAAQLADHITAFSLGGMRAVEPRGRRRHAG